MVFGLAGREGANALMAVANFADGKTPYGARLVLRDTDATLGPYLDARGQPLSKLPLARRLPPPTAPAACAGGCSSRPASVGTRWCSAWPAAKAPTR